jgi:hypothetical protein
VPRLICGQQLSWAVKHTEPVPCAMGPMFEHRIQDHQQFPHAGRQGDLLCLARRTEALIERTDHGIMVSYTHRIAIQSICGNYAGHRHLTN